MVQFCNLDFFNFLDDLFFILDNNGNILEVNNAVTKSLKYDKDILINKNIKDICPDIKNISDLENDFNNKLYLIKNNGNKVFFDLRSMKNHIKCQDQYVILVVAKDLEAEEKYKNIFNNSTQGIYQTTNVGKYLTVNPAFANICGYNSPEEMIENIKDIGKQVYVNQEDRKKLKDYLIKNDKVRDYEVQLKRKDGERIWVSINARSIKDNIGNLLYFEGIVDDITDKKDTIKNYKSLLHAIPDMITRVRKDGMIMDIKSGESIYFQIRNSTYYIGKNLDELPYNPLIIKEIKNCIEEVLLKDEPIEYHYSISINDKERHYYSRIVKNGEDEVVAIIRDITDETELIREVRKAKETSEYNENKYKQLIDTLQEGIWLIDNNGLTTFVNIKMSEMLGYETQEMIGKSIFYFMDEDAKKLAKYYINRRKEGIIEQHDFEFTKKDGSKIYTTLETGPIKDENGNFIGAIAGVMDVTYRREYEKSIIEAKEKAELSDKMKLEFLANMSHDLRTPMNSIIGFSDLLRSNNLTKHDKQDYINTIINNGKFLMTLIDDIIDISKIDAKSLKIENKPFELNKLLDELRLSYTKQIKDKKIDIIIDMDINKNIIINSDKYRIRQILMNLIGNSIKFTNNGHVKFGYKILNNKYLEIYVEDTGLGIRKENQKIIFERFKQLNENTNKFKGTGLGLSITKSLVDLLGFGEVRLQSEFGKGSKFYFQVPYEIKNFNYITDIKIKKHKKIDFSGKTILIVEDDMDSLKIMKSYLSDTNVNIIDLSIGNKVMNIIHNNRVDLILLDIGLPDKSGYDILREIRQYSDRLPVIIESALAMPDQTDKAFELGCDEFLTKPYSKEEFLNKIDKLL